MIKRDFNTGKGGANRKALSVFHPNLRGLLSQVILKPVFFYFTNTLKINIQWN